MASDVMMRQDGIPAISEVKFSLGEQPWLLWRLQFLRADIAPGPDCPGEKSCIHSGGGQRRSTEDPEFKGYIHDVGGPTANFRASVPVKNR